jgi:cytochrome P450
VHVVFQHYVISNTERYFPDTDRFLPERWIGSGGLEAPRHAFASLPFGYGRRMCLGRRFAELEILVVLSKVTRTREKARRRLWHCDKEERARENGAFHSRDESHPNYSSLT